MRRISDDWWIGVDETYRTRVDDGSLVIWRPERTIWINVWRDGDGRSARERLASWVSGRSPRATDLYQDEQDCGGLLRFGYLLEEPEDDGGDRLGVYSYTVSASWTVQMACYFDLREDLGWATAVSRSLSFGGPGDGPEVEERVGELGHVVVASERVIGPDRAPVLLAFREPPADEQDSGWRLFHGDEGPDFTADPENMALCPLSSLLGLDPTLRAVINSPPGSAWERTESYTPWRPVRPHPGAFRGRG